MQDARFTISTSALLAKVVDLLADIPVADRDTKGDLYEYMLSKIATAGTNGQFRTPRHIVELPPWKIYGSPAGSVGRFMRPGDRAGVGSTRRG